MRPRESARRSAGVLGEVGEQAEQGEQAGRAALPEPATAPGATAPGEEARAAAPEAAPEGAPLAARIWLNGEEWKVRLCPSDTPPDAVPDASPGAAPDAAPDAVADEQQVSTAAAPLRARILKDAAGAYVVRLRKDGEATSLPGESCGPAPPRVQSHIEMKEDGTYAVRLLREPLAHAEPEAPQAEQGTAPPPPRRSEVLRDAHALVAQFEAQQAEQGRAPPQQDKTTLG